MGYFGDRDVLVFCSNISARDQIVGWKFACSYRLVL